MTLNTTTDFQWLEAALREHGFQYGVLTKGDEEAIDALLAAIRERFKV